MEAPAAGLAASDHGFVVLACDGALRFLQAADAANLAGNPSAIRPNVENAQRILLELMGALDPSVAPGATAPLEHLYQTLLDRLTDAMNGDQKAVSETRLALIRLRNAWSEAARSSRSPMRGSWACRGSE